MYLRDQPPAKTIVFQIKQKEVSCPTRISLVNTSQTIILILLYYWFTVIVGGKLFESVTDAVFCFSLSCSYDWQIKPWRTSIANQIPEYDTSSISTEPKLPIERFICCNPVVVQLLGIRPRALPKVFAISIIGQTHTKREERNKLKVGLWLSDLNIPYTTAYKICRKLGWNFELYRKGSNNSYPKGWILICGQISQVTAHEEVGTTGCPPHDIHTDMMSCT